MHHTKTVLLAMGCAALLLAGCGTAPVYNVEESSIAVADRVYTQEEVRNAIVGAGRTLGWAMRDAGPGHLIGTLVLPRQMAQVDIRYSRQAYSIHYLDSENLRYDGAVIRSNYNEWIQSLDQAIQAQLAAI